MRFRRIADFLKASHLEAFDRKGLDVSPAERPGRPVDPLANVPCNGQHQQRAA
jgi:hypothetical protein